MTMRLTCLSAALFSLAIAPAAPTAAEEWKLVWSDEFDQDGLPNPEKWGYEEGFIRNNELQYYTRGRKENARVEDGCLVIESRKERMKNPSYDPNSSRWNRAREHAEYTSASVTTETTQAWRYGRVEVRAKLPTGRGMWPAIWMLGMNRSEVGWPTCGEIDIMENVGFDPDRIHANIHVKKYNHKLGTGKGARIVPQEKPYEAFHVYAIEWDEEKIDFYLDDEKYFTFKNEHTGNDTWPFDKPHYLIINAAVGGSWGGARGVDESIFPQRYYIDYVRVYQRP